MTTEQSERRVAGYPNDPVREKEELQLRTYQYGVPFNYPNVEVDRVWIGGEKHGMELFPIKPTDGSSATTNTPGDGIIIREDEPIVQVVVIGSACTPPGTLLLEAKTIAGESHIEELPEALPVRFRLDNLWGMHLRIDLVNAGGHYSNLPVSGMSSGTFDIPPSSEVRVMSAGAIPAWSEDQYPDDAHYSVRYIRTTVAVGLTGRR